MGSFNLSTTVWLILTTSELIGATGTGAWTSALAFTALEVAAIDFAITIAVQHLEAFADSFLIQLLHPRIVGEFFEGHLTVTILVEVLSQTTGFGRFAVVASGARTFTTFGALALLGLVRLRNFAISIGVQMPEHALLFLRIDALDDSAGLKFIETHAAVLVRVQIPDLGHGWPVLSWALFARIHLGAIKAPVDILIETLKKCLSLVLREAGQAGHLVEFIAGNGSISVEIDLFPHFCSAGSMISGSLTISSRTAVLRTGNGAKGQKAR